MTLFDYLARHRDAAAHFSEVIVGFHASEVSDNSLTVESIQKRSV
jgi:hypothetical protein